MAWSPARIGAAVGTFGMSEGGGIRPLYESLSRGGGGGRVPDISAELARIDALISQAREQAKIAINREAVASRRALASNLAVRGGYESPASVLSFEALEGAKLGRIAESEAGLLSQGAGLRAEALSQLSQQRFMADREERALAAQRRASLIAAGVGLGTSVFFGPAARTAMGAGIRGQNAYQTPATRSSFFPSPYFSAGARERFANLSLDMSPLSLFGNRQPDPGFDPRYSRFW